MTSPFFQKVYIVKTDSIGNLLWSKDLCNGLTGYSVIPNYEGGYFVLGKAAGVYNTLIIKTDSIGNIIWTKSFENCVGYKMISTYDSSLVFAGYKPIAIGNRDIYLQKIDYNGSSLWTKSFGEGGFDIANDMKLTKDNGLIVAGESQNGPGGNYRAYIIKTSSTGIIEWEDKYGDELKANAIDLTSDSGYIITASNGGMLLMKLSTSGDLEWSKNLNGTIGYSVIQSNDFAFLIAGYSNNNFYFVKTDPSGNMIWEHEFAKGYFSSATDCIMSNDNGFVIAGNLSGAEGYDIYLVKTDTNGCIQPRIKNIEGPENVTVGDTICFYSIDEYGTEPLNYYWECDGEIFSGQNNDTAYIAWNQTGIDSILLIVSNACGIDSIFHNIQIMGCVPPVISQIHGDSIVVQFDIHSYSINLDEGSQPATYYWSASSGNIVTGQNTKHVTIEWTSMGTGSIDVICTNECGTANSSKTVEILTPYGIKNPDSEFSIYPNPSHTGIFNILPGKEYHFPVDLEIFDVNGKLIYQSTCKNALQINLSNNPKGIYILNVHSENLNMTRKLILR